VLISVKGTGENSWSQVRTSFVLCKEILDQNRPVYWSIVVKEKPTVGSPFFGTFPSDGIPKATEDVGVPFFIHSRNSSKLYQPIPEKN